MATRCWLTKWLKSFTCLNYVKASCKLASHRQSLRLLEEWAPVVIYWSEESTTCNSIGTLTLFYLTADWRRNVMCFMNVKRGKGKKKKECTAWWVLTLVRMYTEHKLTDTQTVRGSVTIVYNKVFWLVGTNKPAIRQETWHVHFPSDHRISLACYSYLVW